MVFHIALEFLENSKTKTKRGQENRRGKNNKDNKAIILYR